MDWKDLNERERSEVYRRYQGGVSVIDLAREYNVKLATLERRFREYGGVVKTPASHGAFPAIQPALRKGQSYILANPTDAHGVYADPVAWELALKCIAEMKPDFIMWGNDCMDLGEISSYPRAGANPKVSDELTDEKRRRKELTSAAPKAQLYWITDNHVHQRMMRYVWNKAYELADLPGLRFESLIGFEPNRITSEFRAGDTLRVIHGTYVSKHPGSSVNKHLVDDPDNRLGRVMRSVMMGHVHRFAHLVLDSGIEGLECGCLQDLRPAYVQFARRGTNWSHGMGFAEFGTDWSRIIPARFYLRGQYLCAQVQGTELRVKAGPSYSGR